jgi:hypothetical protein
MIETEYEPEYDQKCLCANAPIERGWGEKKGRKVGRRGSGREKKSEEKPPLFWEIAPLGLCVASLPCPLYPAEQG